MDETSCDILVVGAGIAGISAAVVAAEKGFKTILIEKERLFGGTIRNAYLNEICGLFNIGDERKPFLLNKGICKRFYDFILKEGRGQVKQRGKVFTLYFSRVKLFEYIDSLLIKNKLLDYRCCNELISLEKSSSHIERVKVRKISNGNSYNIKSKFYIDCSGLGCILKASDQFQGNSEIQQLAGISMIVESISVIYSPMLAVKIPYFMNEAVNKGIFDSSFKFTTVSECESKYDINFKINIDSDLILNDDLRKKIIEIHEYLSSRIDELRGSRIKSISSKICHRENNKLKGRYTLTESDVVTASKFNDGCVKGAWPIEYWDPCKGPVLQYVKSGDYYEIPIRSLKALNIKNLYAAGRCISAESKALASTRVAAICMTLGEQAALESIKQIRS